MSVPGLCRISKLEILSRQDMGCSLISKTEGAFGVSVMIGGSELFSTSQVPTLDASTVNNATTRFMSRVYPLFGGNKKVYFRVIMKVSLNTIKQLTGLDLKIDELVDKINTQLGQVEEVVDLGAKYKDVVVVRVVECEKHPDADKLSVCMIDDGGVVQDVERDERGLVQVVCGAPNARVDMFAAWLPPRSTVPASFGEPKPFVLEAREIRGIKSNGMLAAADELAIGSDHTGIIDITESDLPSEYQGDLAAGISFAKVFRLDDYTIDLENKMFTHRPDCFGQLGVAREIFAIMQSAPEQEIATQTRFTEPDWYWKIPQFVDVQTIDLEVFNEAPQVVPRFMAVAMSNVEVKPSPLWMQIELVRWGSKSINNVVDATNYIMLLTAQPTHAYDYDKLKGGKIGTRLARHGETVKLLNNKIYTLNEEDIVIVDGDGVIGLAGVMGGLDSEVTSETKNIVLECATFDMYSVRKTSMRYGLFTDAVTRFNKGQSWLQNDRVLGRLMDLIPADQASKVFDLPNKSSKLDEVMIHPSIDVKPSFINQRLGLDLSGYAVANLLRYVNFTVYQTSLGNDEEADESKYSSDNPLNVNAPFWRTDIELAEDVVEEVGRLYGFNKLPRELPRRSIEPAPRSSIRKIEKSIRRSMEKAGANEVLTYSFVHENIMKKAEQDVSQAFQLGNALSPDLQYYRLSVLPSLLDKVHGEIKSGHDEFLIYEIGKGHNKKYHADDDDGLPSEMRFVDGVYASKKPRIGAAYYYVRKLVSVLARDLGFTLKFKPVEDTLDYPVTAPFDLKRSALVESRNGEFIGMIGELKNSVKHNFKLPAYVAAMTLDLEGLMKASQNAGSSYRPLSRFPKVTQDISLKVPVEVSYEDVFWSVWRSVETSQIGESEFTLEPLAIYQPKEGDSHKTTTLRLTIASYERTLTDKDVVTVLDIAAESAKSEFGAERV